MCDTWHTGTWVNLPINIQFCDVFCFGKKQHFEFPNCHHVSSTFTQWEMCSYTSTFLISHEGEVSAFTKKWTPDVFVGYWPPYWWTTLIHQHLQNSIKLGETLCQIFHWNNLPHRANNWRDGLWISLLQHSKLLAFLIEQYWIYFFVAFCCDSENDYSKQFMASFKSLTINYCYGIITLTE